MIEDVAAETKSAVSETMKEMGVKPEDFAQQDGAHGVLPENPVEEVTETPASPVAERAADEAETPETPTKETVADRMEEENFRPSAEDLAVIDKSPELKKVYRSMVKGFTTKTEELSNKRKEADVALQAVRALKEDPHTATLALANSLGYDLVKKGSPAATAAVETGKEQIKDIQTKLLEELTPDIGDEAAKVLVPVLIKAVSAVTGQELTPIKQAMEENRRIAQAQGLRETITQFGQKVIEDGGEWNESIEKDMAKLVGKIVPGQGVTIPDFLQVLHNNVLMNRNRTVAAEEQVARLQKAKRQAEPVRPARTSSPVAETITPATDIKKATDLAIAAAKAELKAR